MYLLYFSNASLNTSSFFFKAPKQSTCPLTRCPPICSPNNKDFSIFIFFPFFQELDVVTDRVSFDNSALNEFLDKDTAVKQIPSQHIESPISIFSYIKLVLIFKLRSPC